MKRTILLIFALGTIMFFLTHVTALPVNSAIPSLRPTATPLTPRPTPTNVSGGEDVPEDGGEDVPEPTNFGTVKGYVYNYSVEGGVPQPGVGVILKGDSWDARIVTNADGFYEFAGLGQGQAILNLELPPHAKATLPDLMVYTGNKQPDNANLGFYQVDTPPLIFLKISQSEIKSAANQSFYIDLFVENRSEATTATNGQIDVKLPVALKILDASLENGTVDILEHRIFANFDHLAVGQSLRLNIRASFDSTDAGQNLTGDATFTYDEQPTMQRVNINIISTETIRPAKPTNVSMVSLPSHMADTKAKSESLMPKSGEELTNSDPVLPVMVLAMVIIIGLAIAGFRNMTNRKMEKK